MEEIFNEDDDSFEIVEEIELDDEDPGEGLAYNVEDMTMENEEISNEDEDVEERDDSNLTFTNHGASVFCVSLDPWSYTYGVSGGEDDKAFVWKISDGKVKFPCEGHKDSVISVGFSHDSKYVATADMSGVVKVWEVGTGEEVWSFETSDLEWLQWHHSTHVLFAGTVDGEFWMWKIPDGTCKTFQSHGFKTTSGLVLKDGKHLCAGYADGGVKLWDLKSGNYVFHVTGGFSHSQSVTCLDVNKENTLIASGSEDSTVKLTHCGNGKVLETLQVGLAQEESKNNSVEALEFCSNQPLLATASLSGVLGIWDVTSQRLRHQCRHQAGVTRIRWDKSSPCVYSAGLDGILRLWDARSGNCEREWHGHKAPILDMAISKDGNFIVSSSDDGTVKTFSVIQPGR